MLGAETMTMQKTHLNGDCHGDCDFDALDAIEMRIQGFLDDFEALRGQVGRVIVGQGEVLEFTLMAIMIGGHALLEGVPGLGKTRLVRTMASSLGLRFQRIQFTPDLMPADLIGTNVITETTSGRRRFKYQPGPVFANIVLADEINRATPKTQSALLEAMQEQSVTVGGKTHELPRPFVVLATQNPLEMEGTYPLPEAQLDRFLFKLFIRYPTAAELDDILTRTTSLQDDQPRAVLDAARLMEMGRLIRAVPVSAEVRAFAIAVTLGTHSDNPQSTEFSRRYVRYGSSPRGGQAMILAAKVRALLDHRLHVAREDVRAVAHACLRHRIILNFEGQAEGVRQDDVIDKVLEHVAKQGGSWRDVLRIKPAATEATVPKF
jgi:MoxR-like ATPase